MRIAERGVRNSKAKTRKTRPLAYFLNLCDERYVFPDVQYAGFRLANFKANPKSKI